MVPASEVPIYQQLGDRIVEVGVLTEGSSLPAATAFAADFGIDFHTVNKAYDLLRTRLPPGHGFRVHSHRAVQLFTQDIGMPGVSVGLAEEVDQDREQGRGAATSLEGIPVGDRVETILG